MDWIRGFVGEVLTSRDGLVSRQIHQEAAMDRRAIGKSSLSGGNGQHRLLGLCWVESKHPNR
jgi:hypothetical protein